MKNIEFIIFDLDNTLLHFDDYWDDSVKETFKIFNITRLSDAEEIFKVYKEQDDIYCAHFDAGRITLEELRRYRFLETMKAFKLDVVEEDHDEFQDIYRTIANRMIKPNEKYNNLLKRLLNKYSLAIMTNGSSDFQREKLARMEIIDLFHNDFIFISEEVGYSKPSPEIYQKALNEFRAQAKKVLFVGDSITNDVSAPLKMGMEAVWVNKDNRSLLEDVNPTAIISDVTEMENILVS